MDRIISNQEQTSRRIKTLRNLLIGLTLITVVVFSIRYWLQPTVYRGEILTAVVESGPMIASIAASGTVIPENELIVSAAFDAEIRKPGIQAGHSVKAGDIILELDSSALEADIRDLKEQLALKRNEQISIQLQLEKTQNESNGKLALLDIDLESRHARLKRLKTLAETGAVSKQDVLEAELNVRRTQVEISQIKSQLKNLLASTQTDIKRIELETAILNNRLDQNQQQLKLATLRAPIDGVLTWVLDEPGKRVTSGTTLAKVANLEKLQIEATLSDFYSQQIYNGQSVAIKVADISYAGIVSQVLPTVENGTIKLRVAFTEQRPTDLKPQLRVDVDLITDQADQTLRIKRGVAIPGMGRHALYRIVGDQVDRLEADFGISNRTYIQVLNGLSVGEEVIISDIESIKHLTHLKIR